MLKKTVILTTNKQVKVTVNKIIDKGIQDISLLVTKYSNSFINHQSIWKTGEQEVIDKIYNILAEIYTCVLQSQKQLFNDVNDALVTIDDLTYKGDNKTLPERIHLYWEEARLLLIHAKDDKKAIVNTKIHLIFMLERILRTEGYSVFNGVMKTKYPIIKGKKLIKKIPTQDDEYAVFVHINGCECGEGNCGCGDYEGDYPIDECPWPPYHSNCDCYGIVYVVTNDPDDIHDLDLEVEE